MNKPKPKLPQKLSSLLVGLSLSSCITLASLTASAAANDLPKLGEAAGATLSVSEEQMIGDQIMAQIRRSQFLMKDPLITDYIQQLGHKLVAANPDALGRRFQFFVIQENSINAFALPGGYIGIHSGLITASQSESELASVLGHEVAHVTQRHLARRLEQQDKISIPTILGVIASVIAATQDPEAGIAGMSATQAAAQQSIITHTRDNEQEADRIGITMLAGAGFDVRAAADFFETLQQASRYTQMPPEILLTHPLSRNRIAAARERSQLYPQIEHQNSVSYYLVKARIKSIEMVNNNDSFRLLEQKFGKGQLTSIEDRYLYAELLKKKGRSQQALPILKALYKEYPDNHLLLFTLAEAHRVNKTSSEILPELTKQLEKTPGSTKLILATAQIYLDNNQSQQAEKLLLRYADVNQHNPNYLYLLAEAQAKAGHTPEMHETTGQYLLLLGDLRTAKKHFELALNSTSKDPYAQTRIQARLEEVNKRIREVLTENARSRYAG
ncbi:M48 family metalloprotease [Kangiella sp.]|uniref:beta-barrel assembly-enhancing protease n=1 Tax=Kangiella sp. TaxID=1920245 RepID=UPI0019B50890|nr:M48 family metalloprotease [Kangiella sp.]MBD3653657.1 M48 family metallopeptidase [Kangiella sp.]